MTALARAHVWDAPPPTVGSTPTADRPIAGCLAGPLAGILDAKRRGDQPSRRRFLEEAVALGAAAAGSLAMPALTPAADNPQTQPQAKSPEGPPLYNGPVIDTHQHLWNLDELKLPWVAGAKGRAAEILARNHLLSDYAQAAKGVPISKTIYMEVDVADSDRLREAQFIIREAQSGKWTLAGGVIGARPLADGFTEYLDNFAGQPVIKGVRQVLRGQPVLGEAKFAAAMKVLAERRLSFDLCLSPNQLQAAAEMVDRCEGTRFILDHCGDPFKLPKAANSQPDWAVWERGLAAIAKAKNPVVCKISGLYADVSATDWPAQKLASLVRRVITEFGWDRVIWASDWPVVNLGSSLSGWFETVAEIVATDTPQQQRQLFHDNAARLYGLA